MGRHHGALRPRSLLSPCPPCCPTLRVHPLTRPRSRSRLAPNRLSSQDTAARGTRLAAARPTMACGPSGSARSRSSSAPSLARALAMGSETATVCMQATGSRDTSSLRAEAAGGAQGGAQGGARRVSGWSRRVEAVRIRRRAASESCFKLAELGHRGSAAVRVIRDCMASLSFRHGTRRGCACFQWLFQVLVASGGWWETQIPRVGHWQSSHAGHVTVTVRVTVSCQPSGPQPGSGHSNQPEGAELTRSGCVPLPQSDSESESQRN
jgi:hypothetical protein